MHITLGMALKSVTDSEKIIRIPHSYGHCISYTATLELEIEATYVAHNANQICPAKMILRPQLNSGFAYDNFDRYVETAAEKDTLHDTVGISFQDDISSEDLDDLINSTPTDAIRTTDSGSDVTNLNDTINDNEELAEIPRKRMRRTFQSNSLAIPEFIGKPKYVGTVQVSEVENR